MSLMTVAARAALLKRAGVGRLAMAAGGAGLVGGAALGAVRELSRPTEIPADALGEGAVQVPAGADPGADTPIGQGLVARGWSRGPAGWQSPNPNLRDRLRSGIANLAGRGAGTVLGKWYGAATGKESGQ